MNGEESQTRSRNEKPSGDDIKEVYALFGAAYYYSECLHRELCNGYVMISLKDQGYVLRPRLEEMLSKAFSMTLGKVTAVLMPLLPHELGKQIREAVERRSFLAHHFWYERCHLLTSMSGTKELLAELYDMRKQFNAVDKEAHSYFEPFYRARGLTEERESHTLQAVMRGEDIGPLPSKRLPSKRERIVAVYEVPVSNGGKTLVFECEDGALFQLSDVGLCWAPYESAQPGWIKNKNFADHLPATIDPRPVGRPWDYQFDLGRGSVFWISKAHSGDSFKWGIRRKEAKSKSIKGSNEPDSGECG